MKRGLMKRVVRRFDETGFDETGGEETLDGQSASQRDGRAASDETTSGRNRCNDGRAASRRQSWLWECQMRPAPLHRGW